MRSLLIILACTPLLAQEQPPSVPAARQPTLMQQFRFTDAATTERNVLGRIVVKAQDGGVLVEDQEGAYWNITPNQLKEQVETETEYRRLNRSEHLALLKNRYPALTDVRQTDHFLILSNTGPAYTDWTASLLERYYAAFFEYWKTAGLELQPPSDTLIVLIWREKATFDAFYKQDVGQESPGSFGYYSNRRNHVVLYDFANKSAVTPKQREDQTVRDIERAVKKEPFSVATVVHEATHQLAFNSGLHTRYADNPVWLTEGIAMFCESADAGLASRKPRIGRTNAYRRKSLKQYLQNVSADTVSSLTDSDKRFQSADTANDAYTEAWALTSYLMNRRKTEFIEYIKANQNNPVLIFPGSEARRESFDSTVGEPTSFVKPMQSYLKRIR